MNNSRRSFLRRASILGAAGAVAAGSQTARAQHEHHAPPQPQAPPKSDKGDNRAPSGAPVPVHVPDVPRLPYTIEGGVKVFRLVPEVVEWELIPGKKIIGWGYNGSVPGPTIEVNEGDRVRIVVTNRLPEATSMHWHGLEVPPEMDGVPFLNQPLIEPGQTFTYEFALHQNGTFFYHSHMAMQEMMGMIGFFIIHPKRAYAPKVDRDFGLVLQEWALLPNNPIPNTMAMEFNWLTLNGKAGPAATPMLVRQGERVRIRMINMGMDHHPMHIHGNQFYVTGTEGGRVPETAWYPGNTVLVGVAQARDVEFDAVHAGDWMLHCHLPHHMMNQMVSMVGPMAHAGHGSRTGLGMEEGMGVVRQGHALSEDLGPGMGRGMGMTSEERNVSNLVGQGRQQAGGDGGAQGGHGGHGGHGAQGGQGGNDAHAGHGQQPSPSQGKGSEVQPGQQQRLGQVTNPDDEARRKRVPGYPQDMVMFMDEEVAKPETYGLPPGWTGSFMGMMTMVRVLPPAQYDEVMRRVREGITEPPRGRPAGGHHEHGG
ncbi:MAG TPA: copper oxidase [Pyrinomonadaceae bacterium]|nr:copper oxidase [Pyrinomonadaceae bacterium]